MRSKRREGNVQITYRIQEAQQTTGLVHTQTIQAIRNLTDVWQVKDSSTSRPYSY